MTHDASGDVNPYAAPRTDGEPLVARSVDGAFADPLFSPTQLGVATLFSSVFVGALLLQANYRVMGRGRAAAVATAIGVVVSAAVAFALYRVHGSPAVVIRLAAVITFWLVVRALHRGLYSEHVLAGGRRRSSWWVLAAIVLSFVARVFVYGVIAGITRVAARH